MLFKNTNKLFAYVKLLYVSYNIWKNFPFLKGGYIRKGSTFLGAFMVFFVSLIINKYDFHVSSFKILPVDCLTRVSQYVPEIVSYIEKIINNGFAWVSSYSVQL